MGDSLKYLKFVLTLKFRRFSDRTLNIMGYVTLICLALQLVLMVLYSRELFHR